MTRLSPAGIEDAQCTADAVVAGVDVGTALGADVPAAEGELVAPDGAALVCAVGVAPPPHATRITPARRAARLTRTR
jgi:hypothetical protein